MKTFTAPKFLSVIVLFIAMLTMSNTAKAQASCPYTITNNTGCTLEIVYTIWCSNGWYSNTVTIPPTNSYVVQCWEFPAGCEKSADIELNLIRVDGINFVCVAGSSNTVASCCQSANTNGMFPGAACDPIVITWGTNQCTYN